MTGRAAMLAMAGVAWPLATVAQDLPPGGVQLDFGLSERLEASDNRALDPDSAGTTVTSETALTATLSSETRNQVLALDAGLVLRGARGPGDPEAGLSDPRLGFSYDRAGANSAFSVEARIAAQDIAFLRPLEDFLTDEGTLELPEDLEDLEGEGTRIDRSVSVRLQLGQEGPFGADLRAAFSDLGYQDATSPDLVDSRRASTDLGFRFALTPVLDATLGLGYVRVEEDGEDVRETRSLDVGLAYARPLGAFSFGLGFEETDEGTRTSLRAGRTLDLPRGRIAFGLGATREAEGDLALTGDVSVVRELPDGALRLAADRSVTTTDDGEELRTVLSLDYSRDLTPLAGLTLDVNWLRSEDTGTGASTDEASLGASLGYQLAQDWSFGLGYSYRRRVETGEGTADENSVYVTLGRSFAIRP